MTRSQRKNATTDNREKPAKALLVAGLSLSLLGGVTAAKAQASSQQLLQQPKSQSQSYLVWGRNASVSYPNGDRHHNKYSYYLNPILLGKKNNEDDYFEDTSIAPVYNIYSGGIALGSAATVSEHAEDGIAVGVGAKTDGQMGNFCWFLYSSNR